MNNFSGEDHELIQRWEPVLEGIEDSYTKKVTAILLENQAKSILNEQVKLDEDISGGTTVVGKLGTFQKFAFPLVRRVYPELIANKICGVQPMSGPVSQIFYLGHDRESGATRQTVYSKYNLTYRGMVTSSIFGEAANIDLDTTPSPELSALLTPLQGEASTTFGGQIAAWPDTTTTLGYNVSAGENLTGTGIPEISFHIEQQAVMARTRKMRALWTLEAAQDLRAYHDLDLERELTELLSKEIQLEIDRELIEDLRIIAYDSPKWGNDAGTVNRFNLDLGDSNNFATDNAGFVPAQFTYKFDNAGAGNPSGTDSNVFIIDFSSSALPFAPQHVGHVWSNLLAIINLASQDIYTSTHRGPGTWLLCAPLMASLLESAAKLEGGVPRDLDQTNIGSNQVAYKGKFAGRYDLFVDPLYPEDEILIGYKGANPMDSGFVYAPYIPLQQLPTITDPESFQPRKGILTRYGKAAVTPESRFYRVVRVVGPTANYLFQPFGKNNNGGYGYPWT